MQLKVSEWKERKEGIMRGDIEPSVGTGEDKDIYAVDEEVIYLYHSKREAFSQCCFYVKPASETVCQH